MGRLSVTLNVIDTDDAHSLTEVRSTDGEKTGWNNFLYLNNAIGASDFEASLDIFGILLDGCRKDRHVVMGLPDMKMILYFVVKCFILLSTCSIRLHGFESCFILVSAPLGSVRRSCMYRYVSIVFD